jgi:hypothetical protein
MTSVLTGKEIRISLDKITVKVNQHCLISDKPLILLAAP